MTIGELMVTKRHFDATITVVFLTVIAMGGLRIAAKRRVKAGQTAGAVGAIASATAVAL